MIIKHATSILPLPLASDRARALDSRDRGIRVDVKPGAGKTVVYRMSRGLPRRWGDAEGAEMPLDQNLSLRGKRKGTLSTDGAGEREFAQSAILAGKVAISVNARGGFAAVFD